LSKKPSSNLIYIVNSTFIAPSCYVQQLDRPPQQHSRPPSTVVGRFPSWRPKIFLWMTVAGFGAVKGPWLSWYVWYRQWGPIWRILVLLQVASHA
jgi:hypothetical protein